MRTIAIEHAECAARVSKQHEFLTEQANWLDRSWRTVACGLEFVEQGDWVPEAAQQCSALCVLACLGQLDGIVMTHWRSLADLVYVILHILVYRPPNASKKEPFGGWPTVFFAA